MANEIKNESATVKDVLFEYEVNVSDTSSRKFDNANAGSQHQDLIGRRLFRGPLKQMFPMFQERPNILPENSGTLGFNHKGNRVLLFIIFHEVSK